VTPLCPYQETGVSGGSPPTSANFGESVYMHVGETEFNELVFSMRVTVDYIVANEETNAQLFRETRTLRTAHQGIKHQ